MEKCNVVSYWSNVPGWFYDQETGQRIPIFSSASYNQNEWPGSVREWYETLVEQIFQTFSKLGFKEDRKLLVSPEINDRILSYVLKYKEETSHETLPGYFFDTDDAKLYGSIQDIKVFVDMFIPTNLIQLLSGDNDKCGCIIVKDRIK